MLFKLFALSIVVCSIKGFSSPVCLDILNSGMNYKKQAEKYYRVGMLNYEKAYVELESLNMEVGCEYLSLSELDFIRSIRINYEAIAKFRYADHKCTGDKKQRANYFEGLVYSRLTDVEYFLMLVNNEYTYSCDE